jgi:hypothetical protein
VAGAQGKKVSSEDGWVKRKTKKGQQTNARAREETKKKKKNSPLRNLIVSYTIYKSITHALQCHKI